MKNLKFNDLVGAEITFTEGTDNVLFVKQTDTSTGAENFIMLSKEKVIALNKMINDYVSDF